MHLTAPVAVNRTYLSKLEKGASYPRLEIIAKLAIAQEVEPARSSLKTFPTTARPHSRIYHRLWNSLRPC